MVGHTMQSRWSALGRFVEIVEVLVGREMKGRYKNTAIGLAWSLVAPLMYLMVFYVVFEVVLAIDLPNYASFVFTGVLMWMWVQSALNEATTSITSNPALVGQPGFPVAALPVAAVATNLVNYLVGVPVLLGIVLFDRGYLGPGVFALPLVIALQFTLLLALAYAVAALNVRLRDTQYSLPVLLQLGYYLTPIFYDAERVPAEFRPWFELNPMLHIVRTYRWLLIGGPEPDWTALAFIAALSIALLAIAYRYFLRASQRFLEEL